MLVHRGVTPSIKFAGTHLYTWVERGTVRVKCLAQEHNTMPPARARIRTARTGDERTNQEATAPHGWGWSWDICFQGGALVSGSSSPGSSPGRRRWLRHFTLTVPLSTHVYKWVPAKSILGVTPRWNPVQGAVEILLVASYYIRKYFRQQKYHML